MKILLINWQDRKNPFAGGAEVHLHEIFGRIAKWGHDVTLLCSSFDGASQKDIIDGIKIIRIGKRYNFNFYAIPYIQYLIKKNNYDIIIDDLNKIPFFTPLYIKKTPLLVIFHHFFSHSIYRETYLPLALYVRLGEILVPFVYKKEIFAVVSDSARDELIKSGILEKNIHIIHNAVSPNLHPDFEKKSKYPLILIHGRIKKYKCPDISLHSVKEVITKISTTKCIVAGDGDYLPHLIKLSQKLGLGDKVKFCGFVSEKEKKELLQSAWVVINTSPKEGWGITVIEANACGTPVVASNSPGLRDSVIDGETGFLVEHGNVKKLANRIVQILQNKELRNTLSLNAVKWASKFSWDISAQKMLELIQNIVKKEK